MTKLAIIYYSATGHGTTIAQEAARIAEEAGAEVRLRHIRETAPLGRFENIPPWKENYEATKDLPEATADDIVWADAVIFGTPTRFTNPAAPFQTFIDSLGGAWAQGKLADKAYAAWATAQTGGVDTTIMKIYQMVVHFGGIIVPPGYTDPVKFEDGQPLGVSHLTGTQNLEPIGDLTKRSLTHMVNRVLRVGGALAAARDAGQA